MVIIQVEGGLGNQMFQGALGFSFINKGLTTKLDISKYETQQSHNGYELERVFNINQQYCSAAEKAFVKPVSKLRHKMFGNPYKEKTEWQWRYHATVNKLNSGYLKGYWQCEKYFIEAADLVRQKFVFNPLQDDMNKAMMDKIKSHHSVSLHIRRGDYMNTGISASLNMDYYNAAIKHINDTISNPVYFVFSDDIDWAKENIKEERTAFIGWNKGNNSYIDMQLMSHCKHNIIANSSFSWWGAWLNSNAGKTVLAPQQWMPHLKNGSDVIPEGWVQIPNHF
ncbi:MAG: alpha-1,2-fucosyltransferase [Bacteroidota bacterium]